MVTNNIISDANLGNIPTMCNPECCALYYYASMVLKEPPNSYSHPPVCTASTTVYSWVQELTASYTTHASSVAACTPSLPPCGVWLNYSMATSSTYSYDFQLQVKHSPVWSKQVRTYREETDVLSCQLQSYLSPFHRYCSDVTTPGCSKNTTCHHLWWIPLFIIQNLSWP